MAAEAARVLDYGGSSYFGSAVPAEAPYTRPVYRPDDVTAAPRERTRAQERAGVAVQNVPAVSLFAIFGVLLIGVLMVFVVLAQISYNEVAAETVRLNAQLNALSEQQKRLEIAFESVIDIKEIERYARDTLGMARPDADQGAAVRWIATDNAMIIDSTIAENETGGFSSFISSLLRRLIN